MFNGLIREIGKILKKEQCRLKIASTLQPKIGDSVAVNGVCLTVVWSSSTAFEVELSSETISRIAIENFQQGCKVHLEPPLEFGKPIDGHLMQGHIDGIGIVKGLEPMEQGWRLFLSLPSELTRLTPPKGSIGVDGVSLTIAQVGLEEVEIGVIPHTYNTTLISTYRPGQRVNIETDLFARYLAHLMERIELKNRKGAFFEKKNKLLTQWEEALVYWW